MTTRIIALTGIAGCGKSTVADFLCRFDDYTLVKFADPLKEMLRTLGLSQVHIEGELKEKPCDLLSGKTPRYAMQTLGTEWARNIMGKNFWVNIWKQRVRDLVEHGVNGIVVDDCRFLNEVEAVHSIDGQVMGVIGDHRPTTSEHSSEAVVSGELLDDVIMNTGNIDDLYTEVRRTLWGRESFSTLRPITS